MSVFSKILVPFDDNQDSVRALEYAAGFCTGTGAKITALHIADPKDFEDKRAFQKDLVRMLDKKLQPIINEIHASFPDIKKIDLQIRGLKKPIHDHILEFAAEEDMDFIVMKSEGLFHMKDWEARFKRSNSYKVVLEAQCPVLTFTTLTENPEFRNILVPLDLTDGSLYKMPLAIAFTKKFDARIHLLSSSEHKDDHAELQQQMNDISEELGQMQIKVVKSPIGHKPISVAVEQYAVQNAVDLVMIMNRPGFRWSDLWISPTAKKLICLSKIPVISVRTEKPLEIGI